MPALRTVLVGYGGAGRWIHRPLLQAEPSLVLTHVVTGDPGRRAAATADVPGVQVLSDTSGLADLAPDVVVVATPSATHLPVATAALAAGAAVVVDKPLALSAEDTACLAELAQERGQVLSAFHNRRWDSDTLTAAALLAGGDLGRVVRLESRFQRFRPQVQRRWREDGPQQGGGVLYDLGPHVVDQALHLLGPVTGVYAEVDVLREQAVGDDDVFLALEHASGARSHLWCSAAAPVGGPRLVLEGTLAGWSKAGLDAQEQALKDGWQPGSEPGPAEPDGVLHDAAGSRPVGSLPGRWTAYYAAFAGSVRGQCPPPVTALDAVRVARVLDAARISAGERRVVEP